jgi:hypothetical protein
MYLEYHPQCIGIDDCRSFAVFYPVEWITIACDQTYHLKWPDQGLCVGRLIWFAPQQVAEPFHAGVVFALAEDVQWVRPYISMFKPFWKAVCDHRS